MQTEKGLDLLISHLSSLRCCIAVRQGRITDLEKRVSAFGTKCFRRISGYCWNDIVSNQRFRGETISRLVT